MVGGRAGSIGVAAVAALALAGCASSRPTSTDTLPSRGKTEFVSSGPQVSLVVGTRAARLSGPGEFLPLHLLVAVTGAAPVVLDREGITLELPDGRVLPLATAAEVRRDYRRSLADQRIVQSFVEHAGGAWPSPPFHWLALDMFPPAGGPVPRASLELRQGQVATGNIYFRLGDGATPTPAWYKLLVRPRGAEAAFVVEFVPYR